MPLCQSGNVALPISLQFAQPNPQNPHQVQIVKILHSSQVFPDLTGINSRVLGFYLIGRIFFCINNSKVRSQTVDSNVWRIEIKQDGSIFLTWKIIKKVGARKKD